MLARHCWGVTLCTWQGTGQLRDRVLGAEQGAGGRSCWLLTAAPRVLPWVAQHWHCPPLPMGSCLVPTLLAPCNDSGTVPITATASAPLAIAFSPCRQTGTVPLQPSPSRGACPTPKHTVPTSRPFARFCPCGQLQVCAGSSSPRCVLTAPPPNTSCPAGRHLLRELLRLPPAEQRDTGGLPGTRWLLSPALAHARACVCARGATQPLRPVLPSRGLGGTGDTHSHPDTGDTSTRGRRRGQTRHRSPGPWCSVAVPKWGLCYGHHTAACTHGLRDAHTHTPSPHRDIHREVGVSPPAPGTCSAHPACTSLVPGQDAVPWSPPGECLAVLPRRAVRPPGCHPTLPGQCMRGARSPPGRWHPGGLPCRPRLSPRQGRGCSSLHSRGRMGRSGQSLPVLRGRSLFFPYLLAGKPGGWRRGGGLREGGVQLPALPSLEAMPPCSRSQCVLSQSCLIVASKDVRGRGGVGVGRREGKRNERRGERGTGHYVMTKGQTHKPLQAIGLYFFFRFSFPSFFFFL